MSMNTYVSAPGGTGLSAGAQVAVAPGGAAPGGTMSATSAILWLVGGAAVLSVGTAYLARKGVRPEIGRFDAIDIAWNTTTVALGFATIKLLAYRFHGHSISQAVLLLL